MTSGSPVRPRLIADHFIRYYWRQAAPFASVAAGPSLTLLRQNTGRTAAVLAAIDEHRRRFEGSLAQARKETSSWRQLVSRVDSIVRQMPLSKLQTLGPDRLEFLYENLGQGAEIILKAGVAYCFRRHYALVADLVKGAWARYVRRFNTDLLGDRADLNEFLFGAERADLSAVAPVLIEFQHGECFYCHTPIRDDGLGHVDHFIPWSRYPVDLGHNFVLAHRTCNERKSDFLAATEHLEAWVDRNQSHKVQIETCLGQVGVISDLGASFRIAHWAYALTFGCNGLTWIRGQECRHLDPGWERKLAHAIC